LKKVKAIPIYEPSVFIEGNNNIGIPITFGADYSQEEIEDVSYLAI
jgi:hypothetical protein